MLNICQIWAEECEVATVIKAEMGADKALNYLIGEKFMDFWQPPKLTLISERKFPPLLPKSRRSSSVGKWQHI